MAAQMPDVTMASDLTLDRRAHERRHGGASAS